MKKIKEILTFTIKLTPLIFYLASPLYIATEYATAANSPGCYKIVDGEANKLTCPTSNVVYDNGNGSNTIDNRADPTKCYIYSENLYDGDPSWGEPYVEVDCNSLSSCPDGQELRYSNDKVGAPECVDASTATGGEYAGGAQPPASDNLDLKFSFNGDAQFDGEYYCGKGAKQVRISFNIGCLGNSYPGDAYNPVVDMLFALLRFLTAGVGIVVTGSIIWAGIQYSTSRGDPKSTEASIKRITNSVIALLIYIFSFAILNFIVPGGLIR